MTNHAFDATGKMPDQTATRRPLRGGARRDFVVPIEAFGSDERGVSLVIVPLVGVTDPLAGLLRQKARFNPATGGWIAGGGFQGKGFNEDGFIGKVPAVLFGEVDFGVGRGVLRNREVA